MADFYKENPYNVFWTENINDKKTTKWMSSRYPDVIIQCGWSQIFKKEILKIPKKYCIGIHPSPLPAGRGAAIMNWKIIESNQTSVDWGNSLFIMEEKTDTGAVLDFEPLVIEERDDIRTAYLKVDSTALTMLERTIPKIAKNIETITPQDNSKATRYYKRTPEDGKISLEWPIKKICDFVRALTHPYPGAFLETKHGRIIIWELRRRYGFFSGKVGNVASIKNPQNSCRGLSIIINDKDCIEITRLSDENGNEFWADEWARMVGLKNGDNLIND